MNINDLDHFVLQPGETLILRARKPLSQHEVATLQKWLDERKVPAVVIAGPDFDIMAGVLSNLMPDDEAQAHCDAVIDAYDAGKTLYARTIEGDPEWFVVHHKAFPCPIDFERYEFSLDKPTS